MDSPNERLPFSVPVIVSGPQAIDSSALEESVLPVPTDRLYQIAALAAGIILLVTAF
ncbi:MULTISPECIES: hypothetical protein [Acidobacteriaceae]|uniref:hypothetical protein n=1 Tax=Acidobacteriaceae TaxID=204434 RepID=UPI00131D3584|nr:MULTISPECIES: hypothetical protein [Acidobacteriaceae]MDW5267343.1 hypothetical protein [Edaphobacter sp.]